MDTFLWISANICVAYWKFKRLDIMERMSDPWFLFYRNCTKKSDGSSNQNSFFMHNAVLRHRTTVTKEWTLCPIIFFLFSASGCFVVIFIHFNKLLFVVPLGVNLITNVPCMVSFITKCQEQNQLYIVFHSPCPSNHYVNILPFSRFTSMIKCD